MDKMSRITSYPYLIFSTDKNQKILTISCKNGSNILILHLS